MGQITTCTFFKIEGFADKWWAFKQMQFGVKAIQGTEGLSFFKLLGSGAKNGFSSIPNFGTYVLLCVWDSEENANAFFERNFLFTAYQSKSSECFTAYLHSAEVHGKWDGVQPFILEAKLTFDRPVLVLTRARIRLSKLISFWRRVGKVSETLVQYDGILLAIGVGEWPLIQQATLSIWKTQSEMLNYAYKNEKHREVVLLTRKLNWYKEEMFARFVPYKFQGVWNGENMEHLLIESTVSCLDLPTIPIHIAHQSSSV